MKTSGALIAVTVGFFAFVLLPVFFMVFAPVAQLGFVFKTSVFSTRTLNIVVTSVLIAGAETLFAMMLQLPFAWLVNRTDMPGHSIFDSIAILGKSVPIFVTVVAWVILLSPQVGIINQFFRPLFGGPIFNIFSPAGVVWGIALAGLPTRYIIMSPAVKNIDPASEEASRVAGGSLHAMFLRVTIPSLRQIILITLVLGFIEALENLEFPLVLAPAGHFQMLSIAILNFTEETPPDFSSAASLGVIFLIIALAVFSIYIYLTRRTHGFVSMAGRTSQPSVHLLGRWRWPAFGYCIVVFFLSFLLPLIGILWMSFTIPGRLFTFAGLNNFVQALNFPEFWSSFFNSILLGIATTVIGIPLAMLIAYGVFKGRFKGSRFFEYSVMIPRAFPGIVYGLAIFFTFLFTPGLNILYGTVWPFVFANVVLLSPSLIITASGNMVQIGDELEEASRISGSGWKGTFLKVVAPLAGHAVFNIGLTTFLNSVRELASIILLVTPSFFLFMSLLLDEYELGAGGINAVAAASLFLVLFLGIVIIATKTVERAVMRRH